jgi:hypothetical protein
MSDHDRKDFPVDTSTIVSDPSPGTGPAPVEGPSVATRVDGGIVDERGAELFPAGDPPANW